MAEETMLVEEKTVYQNIIIIVLYFIIIILYLYVAIKEYPIWRRIRGAFFTHKKKHGKESPTLQVGHTNRNLIFYIPLFPFAVLYLALKIALDTFRLFVFYSLDYAEAGLIILGNYMVLCVKKVPEICAAIPPIWNSYIKSPFLKITYVLFDWMCKYWWPVVKQLIITGWTVSTTIIVKGKKAMIYSFYRSIELSRIGWNDFGYPSIVFISWAFVAFVVKPAKWIYSRIKYLARISWYCTCFLIRDFAEDARDLLILGWSISVTLWNHIFNPIGHLICHSTTKLYHKVRENSSVVGRFLYTQIILSGVNDIANTIYGIGSNKTFRLVVEYFVVISPILYNSLVSYIVRFGEMSKNMIPICIKRLKSCSLEIIQDYYITCIEIVAYSSWTYRFVLPITNIVPIVRYITNSMYRHVKGFLLDIIIPVWKVFKLLLRPVISTLSFFYTTVILMIIFASLRYAKWVISLMNTMLIHALQFAQQSISVVFKASELAYFAMVPYFNIIFSTVKEQVLVLYTAIYDFIFTNIQWITTLILDIASAQIYASKEFLIGLYAKYEPMAIDLGKRTIETVDSVVVNIGQGMMEWVKKERELREAVSLRSLQEAG